jgi:regulatory protein
LVAGQITALTPQRGRRERLNVFLDGRFAFGIDGRAATQAGLAVGMALTDADVERLRDADEAARFYDDALRYISYRPRSAAEVERYLRGRGADDYTLAATLGRLQRAGLVDDDAFARYWVENRDAFNPRGARAIRAELRAKGVDQARIDEALNESGGEDDDRAYQAGLKRLGLLKRLDEETFRRRMYAYLQRRGFDYESARSATERLWSQRDDSG